MLIEISSDWVLWYIFLTFSLCYLLFYYEQKSHYIDVIADRTGLDKSTAENYCAVFTDELFSLKIKSQLNNNDMKAINHTENTKD